MFYKKCVYTIAMIQTYKCDDIYDFYIHLRHKIYYNNPLCKRTFQKYFKLKPLYRLIRILLQFG